MELKNKIIAFGLTALMAAGIGVLLATPNKKANEAKIVDAATEYVRYYNDDLGFATRDGGDSRVVLGDSDGGQQSKGNVLSPKCELKLELKNSRDSYWIGVGGYAVYITNNTMRFITLTHYDSQTYGRNAEVSGIVLKTADGSASLPISYFGEYVKLTMRFDLTNRSAAKLEYFVEYNDVTYYPYNGENKIGVYTYTNTASTFSSGDYYRAMVGANLTDSGLSMVKLQTQTNKEKDLSNVISGANGAFNYSRIGDFTVSLPTNEKISSYSGYLNDHLNEWTDKNGSPINVGDGILINGKTLRYWVEFNAPNLIIDSSSEHGVHEFPVYASSVFSPVAVNYNGTRLKFYFNTAFIPADSIVVTFKAGVFSAYYNNTTFVLSEDLTFYSTLNTSDYNTVGSNIKFTTSPAEIVHTDYIYSVDVPEGFNTAANGAQFKRCVIATSIPKDATHINQQFPYDHYRYMFENVLFNGHPLTYYNVWGRANDKDFTDRSTPTYNLDYELDHPTSGINYNMVTYLQVAAGGNSDEYYTLVVEIPNQLMTDFGYTTYDLRIRDGSVWKTPEGVVRFNMKPADQYAVTNFVDANMHFADVDIDNNSDTGACKNSGYYLTAKAALNDLTSDQKDIFEHNTNTQLFANARARYQAWAVANNDAAPFDGNDSIVTPISRTFITIDLVNKDNTGLIIIAAIGTLSAFALIGFVAYKRRKVER